LLQLADVHVALERESLLDLQAFGDRDLLDEPPFRTMWALVVVKW
jgi:hypothetical protein